MAKFGRGLNREVVAAVNQGFLAEPLTTKSIRAFIASKRWHVTEQYLQVALANGASDKHSESYVKYFRATGRGQYRVRDQYRGPPGVRQSAGTNW